MTSNQELTLDDFKAQLLDRFRKSATLLAERELVRMLHDGAFKEFAFMKEQCEQVRLIAARIFEATPPGNQALKDMLAQMNDEIDELVVLYQTSLLNLPQATIPAVEPISRKQL